VVPYGLAYKAILKIKLLVLDTYLRCGGRREVAKSMTHREEYSHVLNKLGTKCPSGTIIALDIFLRKCAKIKNRIEY